MNTCHGLDLYSHPEAGLLCVLIRQANAWTACFGTSTIKQNLLGELLTGDIVTVIGYDHTNFDLVKVLSRLGPAWINKQAVTELW